MGVLTLCRNANQVVSRVFRSRSDDPASATHTRQNVLLCRKLRKSAELVMAALVHERL